MYLARRTSVFGCVFLQEGTLFFKDTLAISEVPQKKTHPLGWIFGRERFGLSSQISSHSTEQVVEDPRQAAKAGTGFLTSSLCVISPGSLFPKVQPCFGWSPSLGKERLYSPMVLMVTSSPGSSWASATCLWSSASTRGSAPGPSPMPTKKLALSPRGANALGLVDFFRCF